MVNGESAQWNLWIKEKDGGRDKSIPCHTPKDRNPRSIAEREHKLKKHHVR
jgi:hypothetical protein